MRPGPAVGSSGDGLRPLSIATKDLLYWQPRIDRIGVLAFREEKFPFRAH
jgi:hypothetical protein